MNPLTRKARPYEVRALLIDCAAVLIPTAGIVLLLIGGV